MATGTELGQPDEERADDPGSLIRDRRQESPTKPSLPKPLLAAALVSLLVVVVAAGLIWFAREGRQATGTPLSPWTTIPSLTLAKPLDGPAAIAGPWARLRLEPAQPGPNQIVAAIGGGAGTPTPADGSTAVVTAVTLEPLSGDGAVTTIPAAAFAAAPASIEIGAPGWWRATVSVLGDDGTERATPFYFLLPDPNVNGPEAVPEGDDDDEAAALFARALAAHTGLHRVRFWQTIGDGLGHLAISEQAVTDGADGSPAAYALRVPESAEMYVVGDQRWTRRAPDAPWQVDNSGVTVPPADWGETYAGATGFRLGAVEQIDGEASQLVSFVVPTTEQPRRQEVAWYAWWVGLETGRLHREAMISRSHYMLNEFRDFDAPLAITPPADGAPGATPDATPGAVSAATPGE